MIAETYTGLNGRRYTVFKPGVEKWSAQRLRAWFTGKPKPRLADNAPPPLTAAEQAALEAKDRAYDAMWWRHHRAQQQPASEPKIAPVTVFPLLGLRAPFSRADVTRAFRRQSLKMHPDHGGDPIAFRWLLAERERALAVVG
jgi:hypothetical protein